MFRRVIQRALSAVPVAATSLLVLSVARPLFSSKHAPATDAKQPASVKRVGNDESASHLAFEVQWPEATVALKGLLGDRFSTYAGELEVHGKEISGYATPANPQAVVWPTSTAEVSEIMKICYANDIPVVPFAAGTSVEGHTVALRGGLCMDVRMMDRVLSVNAADMDVVVQPGVGWMDLNDYCRPFGFFLGVDPAPGACIGGMCGTNCSGTNAVRYGVMREQVINLTVVLADGTVVKTGQRARKSSAGYDLARLFIGSEGTLGIVTEATLRMRHIPEVTRLARVGFPSVHAAADAVIEVLQHGVQLGAIELLDEEMAACLNSYSTNLGLPEMPCILFKFTGPATHVEHDLEVVRRITARHTPAEYVFARTDEDVAKLWGARKHAFWAAQAAQPPPRRLMATDVCVPISRLADCIAETKKDLKSSFLFAPIVGHVGDGNFHVCIMFNPEDPLEAAEAARLNSRMVLRAIAMDGTCTGEHGVGTGKMRYLPLELGEPAVALMRVLKRALDPKNILNPGKIIDLEGDKRGSGGPGTT